METFQSPKLTVFETIMNTRRNIYRAPAHGKQKCNVAQVQKYYIQHIQIKNFTILRKVILVKIDTEKWYHHLPPNFKIYILESFKIQQCSQICANTFHHLYFCMYNVCLVYIWIQRRTHTALHFNEREDFQPSFSNPEQLKKTISTTSHTSIPLQIQSVCCTSTNQFYSNIYVHNSIHSCRVQSVIYSFAYDTCANNYS